MKDLLTLSTAWPVWHIALCKLLKLPHNALASTVPPRCITVLRVAILMQPSVGGCHVAPPPTRATVPVARRSAGPPPARAAVPVPRQSATVLLPRLSSPRYTRVSALLLLGPSSLQCARVSSLLLPPLSSHYPHCRHCLEGWSGGCHPHYRHRIEGRRGGCRPHWPVVLQCLRNLYLHLHYSIDCVLW
jgi:hypothetical protein